MQLLAIAKKGKQLAIGRIGRDEIDVRGGVSAMSDRSLGVGGEVVGIELRATITLGAVNDLAGVGAPVRISLLGVGTGEPLGVATLLGAGREDLAVAGDRDLLAIGGEREVPPCGDRLMRYAGARRHTTQGDVQLLGFAGAGVRLPEAKVALKDDGLAVA